MNQAKIEELRQRIERITKRLDDKAGKGIKWDYTFPDGVKTTYSLKNLKAPEDWMDDFANLANWIWSLKDYIKKYLITQGKNGSLVENYVNQNIPLQLCADIANSLKHCGLDKASRSGHTLIIGQPNYTIPQEGIGHLSFLANAVEIAVAKPEVTEIKIPITAQNGMDFGDGFKILEDAMNLWEGFL